MQTDVAMKPPWKAAAVATASVLLGGCLAPAQTDQMMVHSPPSQVAAKTGSARLLGQVAITHVSGGKATQKIKLVSGDYAEVGNDELREALRLSLQASGYLSADSDSAPYQLRVDLVDVEKPQGGAFDVTVVAIIRYVLTSRDGGKPLFDELVNASCNRSVSDDLIGTNRVRHAEECAVRNNITTFIDKLGAANPTQ
jgi:hypothetical protein